MAVRDKVDKVLGIILVMIMGTMVVNVLWQVFTRFVINNPSSFTDELARYLMIWLGILGAAYASGKNMHVAIDVFASKFNHKTRDRFRLAISILIIAFAALALVGGGLRLVYITLVLDQNSPALQIPLSVVYSVIPISGALIIFYKTGDLLNK